MLVTQEYVTTRHLHNHTVSTKGFAPFDCYIENDTPIYFTLDQLKELIPYFNHNNAEYNVAINEELNIIHIQHLNTLGSPLDVISPIEAVDEMTQQGLQVFELDFGWKLIDLYNTAVYKCAVMVQIVKHLIQENEADTFAGASIDDLKSWNPYNLFERPFIKHDEETFIETMREFVQIGRGLSYTDRRRLKDNYPFDKRYLRLIDYYERDGNLALFYEKNEDND